LVGRFYECYQNAELFSFMDGFCRLAGGSLDTFGSLKNGRIVWALAKLGTDEYFPGDPVEKYVLMRNAHGGPGALEILFTDVRAACENTLSAALEGAGCRVSFSRAASRRLTVGAAEKVLGHYARHQKSLKEAMRLLVDKRLSGEDMLAMARALTRPVKSGGSRREDEDDAYGGNPPGAVEIIMWLADSGRGTEIPGVRGTAYGFLNAFTEYADHDRRLSRGRGPAWREAGFESKLPGACARLKQDAFDLCLAAAA
jgi:phage/plasmid-like protein (TIGR03299 family)